MPPPFGAMLHLNAGRHPDDPALSALVGELSIRSEEFRRFWSDNNVHQRTTGTKDYHHPLVGDLTVTYQALAPGDDPDQILFIYGATQQPVRDLPAPAGPVEHGGSRYRSRHSGNPRGTGLTQNSRTAAASPEEP